ncbi:hypothetical protein [Nitrososphaera sp.]|uniref:hypothetical protein n=1 Tax=Nitrososphaera sp. TaxID=1971748 RepID=UPI0031821483
MYPYRLEKNPYPSSPTPTLLDAQILGGRRHKEAKAAVLSCFSDLHGKVGAGTATDKDFRLLTVIQDVGSGKTHLALHIKGLKEVEDTTVTSYVDLSVVSPKNMHSLYAAMLGGFTDEYIAKIRRAVVMHVCEKGERDSAARKVFNYGFMDSISGRSLKDKAELVLHNAMTPNYSALSQVLAKEFTPIEVTILKLIVEGKFRADAQNVSTLEDIIASLAALASLNLRFLKRITVFQLDEFESDRETTEFVKAVINAHIPAAALMLIFTPSSYNEIRQASASVFDRLEKANYKVDLAGSNTYEEILDIIMEYIRHHDATKCFTPEEEKDLAAKVKVIYDEFSDFRNVRSMLNIMYHAVENAGKRDCATIDEQALDDTIKNVYPGLRIRGSVMDVPISDFIKIRRNCSDITTLESGVKDAVRNLVNYAHEVGAVAKPQKANGSGFDVMFSDPYGTKVAVAIVINQDHAKSFEQISNTLKTTGFVDKLVILTNANTSAGTNGSAVVTMDRCKMIDLIYFSNKYKNSELMEDDSQRALMLAKSIRIC